MLDLDNLFLNIEVSQALLYIGVTCCKTTLKNVSGFLKDLVEIKEYNRLYLWDSCIAHVEKDTLYFF